MQRRVIISLLIILIVGVVLGTGYFIILRLRASAPSATTTPSPQSGALQSAGSGSTSAQQLALTDPTGDPDSDGLTNAQEALWNTDPMNPDTDHDGYTDGEEVKAGHNPTIPAPNDKLPPGFVPGQNLQPLTPAASQPVAVDQFFQNNLDLTLGTKNYTAEYKSQYPEEKRTPDTLKAYVSSQPIVTQLPTPADKSIQALSEDSPLALKDYIDVAGNLSIFSKQSVLADAFQQVFSGQEPTLIKGLAASTRAYQQTIIQLKVPPAAINLQKLLLGYSQLVAATYDQIATYPSDQARSVLAMRQLETNDKKYMPIIIQEVNRLKALATQQTGE